MGIVGKTGWVCIDCRAQSSSKLKDLQSTVVILAVEVIKLRNDLSQVTKQQQCTATKNKNAVSAINTTNHEDGAAAVIPDNRNTAICSTVEIVHRTLADVSRRKRNIVIVGMPERDDDKADFLTICEENRPVKPSLVDDECIRIGRHSPAKQRLLLVKLRREEAALDILHVARCLRQSTDNLGVRT